MVFPLVPQVIVKTSVNFTRHQPQTRDWHGGVRTNLPTGREGGGGWVDGCVDGWQGKVGEMGEGNERKQVKELPLPQAELTTNL